MKKRRLWLVVLSLIFSLCVCFCLSACSSCENCNGEGGTVVEPVVLAVPEVKVDDDGLATWAEVSDAISYAYKIDNGDEHYTNIRNCQLQDGQSIAVKAKGDGAKYVDSEYCTAVKYTATDKPVKPTALTVPNVSILDGTASWTAVANADGYVYQIRDNGATEWGEEQTTTSTSVENLTEGQSIRVKAQSNSENYTESGWSDIKTVPVKGTEIPDPAALTAPNVSITDGTASWTAVANADGYVYQIREKDATVWGEEQTTTSTSVANLTEGQSIRVKAQSNSENYTDSDWSDIKTVPVKGTEISNPDIPTIYIEDDGSVYWTAVDGASKYEIEIKDDKTYETSLNYFDKGLTDGQLIRIRAVKTVLSDDNLYDYVYGEWSEWKTYYEPELDIPNGIKFVFTDGRENTSGYTADELNTIFESASSNTVGFDEITSASSIFRDKDEANSLKFGSSKNNGSITLSLKKEVVMVIINCKKYSSDSGTITINNDGATAQSATAAQGDLVYTLAAPSKTVTIKSEKRVYIYGITVFFSLPEALEKPEVEIDPYGVATWNAVANASGYSYSVNGEDKGLITERRVELNDGDTIIVTAVGDGVNYLSNVSDEKTYIKQYFTLEKPVVTISRGVAYWNIDKNATGGYVYRINGGEEQSAPADGSVQLENGQTIEVKALGNEIFSDSDWSDEATYTRPATATQLGAPVVTVERDGTVSWTHNGANYANDAVGYKYTVDGAQKDGAVQLKDGETIAVVALGDGVHFTDSPATSVTYKAPANKFDAPANLRVEIEGVDRGAVILKWNAVDGASSYAYIVNEIYENAVVVNDNTVRVDLAKIDATKLGGTWSFRVMTLGDGNNGIASDGDYSARFEDSGYCDMVEFRVQRGGDDKIYSVSEIVKVINYFGSRNLPDDTFKVSGTVSENTAYGSDINITLKEGEEKFVLPAAVMPDDFRMAGENLFRGFTVTAEGKLSVNRTDGENRLVNSTAEVVFETLNDRFSLASATLRAIEELQFGTEHTENFTLPTALYGVNVYWSIQASSENVFSFDDETGIATVTPPAAGQDEELVELKADLYYGDLEGDEVDFYEPEDEDELTFDIVIPAIVIIKLDAPRISIDPKTGVATWTAVEHAIGYKVDYYGFIDGDYNNEYVFEEDLLFEPDDELQVQLYNGITIYVQALGDDNYYSDSDVVSKKYTYYPDTVTPDGEPLVFDFKAIPQNDTNELAQPTSYFLTACENAAEFISVTTKKVYLGNSSSNTDSHIGAGFLKSGSSSANGVITLTFGKKVTGVVIECQTWSNDSHEQVSVNGSDKQTASKNDWGNLTFNFGTAKASDTVEITTYGRVFIKSITVYLGDK